jgi:hypothetical protein
MTNEVLGMNMGIGSINVGSIVILHACEAYLKLQSPPLPTTWKTVVASSRITPTCPLSDQNLSHLYFINL